ncbi:NAD-dependent succinate-semialdehyde dehydrogenase [Klenkia taihuensis]|uniref:Succinate-semialdehyde dehydrogenase / glutarate-semialdehyde dehydrogenase n=1 Tax=Klenkia taihuensis TaxID=1225127 RepID=A0A1I1HZM8_9ACTN|nr:NAD-dependent succinate-semialdehyde dehydrogenase [Klenkia taihuensis]GHE08923.1 succinate-semialdehyde dehydrogenase [Klenkia taihuensis]SFC29356.1 succinate-semialdehyde dehydrogenase / glutarate-semialdehyde dehydrogenase [Klenkia taihuensis]
MSEYAVVDPATGETVASYPTATDEQVEAAIAAATAAHRGWSRSSTAAERGELVRRVAQLHRERRAELAALIVREMGKTITAAEGEVDFAADIYEYYADVAERITADQPIDLAEGSQGTAVIRRASLGPLLGVMPWNFPYYQVARFAGPNLVVGNTIILKHAPQCPESAAAIEQVFLDAGFPEGAYVNVYASNDQAATIIGDPRVQGVSLTGSERAGTAVAEVAGRNLKKVALELGGSDPFILLSTDDLDAAVGSAVDARMDNSGQSCNAAKRFVVHADLYDEFLAKLTERMTAIRPGDPTQPATELGPLSSLRAAETLDQQVQRAVAAGATLVAGGKREGAFFEPTVLTGVGPDNPAYGEEFFGPVAVVHSVPDEDAAVELANDTGFGLGSYVFTTDADQGERVANRIEAGMVYVNLVLADSPELPFGGIKRSGTSREMGLLAAEEFVNKKLVRIG